MSAKRPTAFLLVLASFIFLVVACGRVTPGASTSGASDVEVTLKLAKAPALYEPVEVTVTVTAKKADRSPVEAWLELPPSAAFINGQTKWMGDLGEGETHQLKATIAFVAEGISSLTTWARFPHPTKINGMWQEASGQMIRVTKSGGEFEPIPKDGEPSYGSSGNPLDGGELLNQANSPQLLVIPDRRGLDELQRRGLVPDVPWGRWHSRVVDSLGVLEGDFESEGVLLALFDKRRPSTGFQFAVLRDWGGAAAVRMLGERVVFPVSQEPPVRPSVKILDIVATAPMPDWPVENREVSPYQFAFISDSEFGPDGKLELVVWVNGEEVNRYILERNQITGPVMEIELPQL